MAPGPALLAAYRATRYVVLVAGDSTEARIGEPAPSVEALLARLGYGVGAFVTAANPRSEPRPPHENEAANERLAARLVGEAERRDLVVGALAADRGRKGGEAEAESENDRQEAHQSLQDRPTSITAP